MSKLFAVVNDVRVCTRVSALRTLWTSFEILAAAAAAAAADCYSSTQFVQFVVEKNQTNNGGCWSKCSRRRTSAISLVMLVWI